MAKPTASSRTPTNASRLASHIAQSQPQPRTPEFTGSTRSAATRKPEPQTEPYAASTVAARGEGALFPCATAAVG
jgi:hypothetical protein